MYMRTIALKAFEKEKSKTVRKMLMILLTVEQKVKQGRIQEFPDGGVQNFLGGCKFFEERFDSERLYERQREGTAFLNLPFTSMCYYHWNPSYIGIECLSFSKRRSDT